MVSVIIPAHNAAQCIKRAIDSVLSQSCRDYEIFLLHDTPLFISIDRFES